MQSLEFDDRNIFGWCKSNCSFVLSTFAILYGNTLLNKCGYVIYHFNAYFSYYVFFFLMTYYLLSVNHSVITPAVVHQAPLFMEFSRQEYWSGLPFPSPGDLPNPGIKLGSPALQVVSLPTEPPGKPVCCLFYIYFGLGK